MIASSFLSSCLFGLSLCSPLKSLLGRFFWRLCPFLTLALCLWSSAVLLGQIVQKVVALVLVALLNHGCERRQVRVWLCLCLAARYLAVHANLLCVGFSLVAVLFCLCDTAVDALLRLVCEFRVCFDLFLFNGFVDDGAETIIINSRIADHNLLVNLVHVAVVFGIGGQQSIAFLVAALVFLGKVDDRVLGDGVGKLSAVKVSPVENVVVNVERVVGAAGIVVASPAALVAQDGIGEGNLLEFDVSGIFVLGLV
jgi:hypothetical protein